MNRGWRLDESLRALAADWQVLTATVRAVLNSQQLDERQLRRRWRCRRRLVDVITA